MALLLALKNSGQCLDVYNQSTPCPTDNDSLTVYNNAVSVYDFYENNKLYKLTRTTEVKTKDQQRDVFDNLIQARHMFHLIRKGLKATPADNKFAAGNPSAKYKDIDYSQYYQEIDDYKFYQREIENQIVNAEAPISMYDTRICPIVINEYKCLDSTSAYYNDLVNLPLYIPVTVKPYMLLTSTELQLRNSILKTAPIAQAIPKQKTEPMPAKIKEVPVRTMLKREIEITNRNAQYTGVPIYALNGYGAGALLGFLAGRNFTKINPNDYATFAVPAFAQEILKNDDLLKALLKQKFGNYIQTITP